jgi:hypothetical protein
MFPSSDGISLEARSIRKDSVAEGGYDEGAGDHDAESFLCVNGQPAPDEMNHVAGFTLGARETGNRTSDTSSEKLAEEFSDRFDHGPSYLSRPLNLDVFTEPD